MVTRLRKAATDNGFDIEELPDGPWFRYFSTKAPLKIWLAANGDSELTVALSQRNVAHELTECGVKSTRTLPTGSCGAIDVGDFETLHRYLRRAFQLSRTLPHELLHQFRDSTAGLARATEIERLAVQRIGQDIYRQGLIDYWEGRCAITGLDVIDLLRASHIKPWADCADDAERLDVFNGFLLAPHLDAVFDRGFITISEDGNVVVSPRLTQSARTKLCVAKDLLIARLTKAHRMYLLWHREHVFR